jgi:hypothetical protein
VRSRFVLVALGLAFAACGAAAPPSKLDQTTPGANTGGSGQQLPQATAVPDVTPEATPGVLRKPVTKAEKRVIRAWSDQLRRGHVAAASRHFAVPAIVANPDRVRLDSRADVEQFNRTLPCGAKLIRTTRGEANFVVGVFRLTERPGSGQCGTGTGQVAVVAFLIEEDHIAVWFRVSEDEAAPEPTATATPSPTPTATPTASPTPSETATPAPTNDAGFVESA